MFLYIFKFDCTGVFSADIFTYIMILPFCRRLHITCDICSQSHLLPKHLFSIVLAEIENI